MMMMTMLIMRAVDDDFPFFFYTLQIPFSFTIV